VTRKWSWLAAAFTWLACLSMVAAQPLGHVPVRAISVAWGSQPLLNFSERDFVDAGVVAKLQSGLPQTIATRIYVYTDFDRDPVAISAVSCRVVYDLWEGGYRIERQTETSDRTLSVKALEGVIAHCLTFQNHSVGTPATYRNIRGSDVYFAVVTELNPLSQDAVQRIRRWLARPAGNELNGNAFFGTFVSIFVGRKLGPADKTLSFRSPAVGVPP